MQDVRGRAKLTGIRGTIGAVYGAGITVFALCAIAGTAMVSCSPGQIDCSDPAKGFDCTKTNLGVAIDVAVNAMTVVKNCAAYPTLGKMDGFFKMRCGVGVGASCHGSIAAGTQFAEVWKLIDKEPKVACDKAKTKLIDKANPQDSFILHKVKAMADTKGKIGACPPGGGGDPGTFMPPPMGAPSYVAGTELSMDEVACIESFVKAAAGKL